jgi:lipoprotein NlpD
MNRLAISLSCAMLVVLVGCASPTHRAPIEERSTARPSSTAPTTAAAPAPAAAEAPKPLPGAENAGKPGYYTVKPGDTVLRVALDNGQNWRDIVRWNNMDNPNVIEVGQVIRVAPPNEPVAANGPRPVTTAKVETKPLDGVKPPTTPGSAMPASGPAPASTSATPVQTPAPPSAASAMAAAPAGASSDDDVVWAWPAARSTVASGFEDTRSRGLVFHGKAGDAVLAAADGKVIYAGNGLRGYGNLLIIRHNTNFLTAYAHNQTLMVKEDQNVKRGQKIAEMGSTDAERVQLQFELRRQGKPVDPAKVLPPR